MLKNFKEFIIHPSVLEPKKPNFKEFMSLVGLNFLIMIPLAVLIHYIEKWFGIRQINLSSKSTTVIVFGVFIAPILEEIIFRSWLKWTNRNIYIFIAMIFLLIGISFFRHKFQHISFIFILILIAACLIFLLKYRGVEPFINRNLKYFYWGSSTVFGLIHATNFTGNIWYLVLFSFILGSPQIVGGFILGYIRLNYGLRYSMLLHIFINSYLLLSLLHK